MPQAIPVGLVACAESTYVPPALGDMAQLSMIALSSICAQISRACMASMLCASWPFFPSNIAAALTLVPLCTGTQLLERSLMRTQACGWYSQIWLMMAHVLWTSSISILFTALRTSCRSLVIVIFPKPSQQITLLMRLYHSM
jgi:hypothetical protein